ncbi:hypothetical protein [Desulfovibrio sp.]|nr:hypothetical protein [Desulfovibrio sp.]
MSHGCGKGVFAFEKGETRGGSTAPPEKGKTFQHPKKNDARRFP